MEQAYKLLTVGEFLDVCPKDQRHYELFDGIIVAMAPPGQAHQIIHMNLASELGAALRAHHPVLRHLGPRVGTISRRTSPSPPLRPTAICTASSRNRC
jgi:Uma2 family endonuclease